MVKVFTPSPSGRGNKTQGHSTMYQQHWTASLTPLMAVGVALLLGASLIWASGASVLEAYGGLLASMCGSWQALSETGVAATPYILTGLAVALGFRGGVFNIGAEGQLYVGALGAVVVGYAIGGLPIWWYLPLALTACALGGALWAPFLGSSKLASAPMRSS